MTNQLIFLHSTTRPVRLWAARILTTCNRLMQGCLTTTETGIYGGTEAFAEGQRFGLFPALSAGYVLIDEKGKQASNAINYLKLRSSAGMVGSSNLGTRFAFRELYVGGSTYYFGNTNAGASSITEGSVANPDLTFEQSYQYDFGLDARLFNILDASLVLFQQDRKNILTSQSTTVPALFGGSLPNVNKGEVRNRGIELSLLFSKQYKNSELLCCHEVFTRKITSRNNHRTRYCCFAYSNRRPQLPTS